MAHVPCIAGTIVQNHLKILSERFGESRIQAALDTLPEGAREALRMARPMSWLPVADFDAFYSAISSELGTMPSKLQQETASAALEQNLRTVWRMMLKLTSDSALIKRTPMLFSKVYNTGQLESTILEKGKARVTLSKWPHITAFPIRSLATGIETVLRVAGRNDVRVEPKETQDGASFTVYWRS